MFFPRRRLEDLLTDIAFTEIQLDVLRGATGPHRPRDVASSMALLHSRLDELYADVRERAVQRGLDASLSDRELYVLIQAQVERRSPAASGAEASAPGTLADPPPSRFPVAPEFTEMLNSLSEAVLVADGAARYVHANDAASDLLGYSVEELLSLGVPDVSDAWSAEGYLEYLRQRRWDGRARLRHKDGHVLEVKATGRVLPVPSGVAAVCIIQPVRPRRRAHPARRSGNV